MNWFIFSFTILKILVENCFVNCDIESATKSYYNSEIIKKVQKQWENDRKSYENALKLALRDNFGTKEIDGIERINENACKLSNGFYIFDNVVHVILEDMYLKELPHLKTPEVSFPLTYNVLLVDAELSRMIVETKYHLMRNYSEVEFSGTNQDPFKTSPFAFQEVQDKGYLT
ncbi:unnamed protein product [Parnassius mnemosyne]|uniref:Uncharacterized protein n=1 Tax=Parnassius mnemosyne TaxID=213953 RepID=A0AAV1KEX4_9NEOP